VLGKESNKGWLKDWIAHINIDWYCWMVSPSDVASLWQKAAWHIEQTLYHPNLCNHIDRLKSKDYKRHKLAGHGYNLLPKRELWIPPWEEVVIDLLGALES